MNNKKIIITGATSGIGLEISQQLSDSNSVYNISRKTNFDLSTENGMKKSLLKIKEINPNYLFLNAGIAYFSSYDKTTFDNIDKLLNINLKANIWFISQLSEEIKEGLSIVVTLSTASYINGAYEALYNSSKKALKEYIVSINTELKDMNINNQIFMFVPHKIENTLMTSKENKATPELKSIVKKLIICIDEGKDSFIPKYESIYRKVFEEYKNDPYEQGKKSIEYKRSKDE